MCQMVVSVGKNVFCGARKPDTCETCMQAWKEGRLREIFGTGTACIVQPIHCLYRDTGDVYDIEFDAHDPTTLASRLLEHLTNIHHGRVPHDWSVPFE